MESTPSLLIYVSYLVLGYLIGSLPFAVIVSRAFGLADPRGFGSGNPGATNVLRTGNKFAALLTLLPEFLRAAQDYDIIIYGALLMMMVMFMPRGLIRGVPDLLRKLLKKRGGKHA